MYAVWYAFGGIIQVEFKIKEYAIQQLKKHNPIFKETLECFNTMSNVMVAELLDPNAWNKMQNTYPEYVNKFNKLRKLMYTQPIVYQSTLY